jgi:hypothetical protein
MQVSRITLILRLTTTVGHGVVNSTTHIAGWTESVWSNITNNNFIRFVSDWANARAGTLPKQAQIIGYRVSTFNTNGNRIIPGPSRNGNLNMAGNVFFTVDQPQVSLSCQFTTVSGSNVARIMLRATPDEVVQNGEYAPPDAIYPNLVTVLFNVLQQTGYGWVGRDLSQGLSRVNSIVAGVLTTDAPIQNVIVGSYVRFHRVTSDVRLPVAGSYLVTAVAGNAYTIPGLAGISVTKPNGLVRNDVLAFFNNAGGQVLRSAVRKIGRPSNGYRGRRSKVRR